MDFEYHQPDGELPTPLCMVAREYRSGRTLRYSGDRFTASRNGTAIADSLETLASPPFSTSTDALFVAYYASAELNCFLRLGWSMPLRILDLFTEFRNITNGLPIPCGNGLLGALAYYGIDGMAAVEKDTMRELAMRGGP